MLKQQCSLEVLFTFSAESLFLFGIIVLQWRLSCKELNCHGRSAYVHIWYLGTAVQTGLLFLTLLFPLESSPYVAIVSFVLLQSCIVSLVNTLFQGSLILILVVHSRSCIFCILFWYDLRSTTLPCMVTAWITSLAIVIVANMWLLRSWWLVRMAHLTNLKMKQHSADAERQLSEPLIIRVGNIIFKVRTTRSSCYVCFCAF